MEQFPIKRTAIAMTWIGENYLGFDKNVTPMDTTTLQNEQYGMLLFDDTFKMGNFGKACNLMKSFERDNHIGNFDINMNELSRQFKLFQFSPIEVIGYQIQWILSKLTRNNK